MNRRRFIKALMAGSAAVGVAAMRGPKQLGLPTIKERGFLAGIADRCLGISTTEVLFHTEPNANGIHWASTMSVASDKIDALGLKLGAWVNIQGDGVDHVDLGPWQVVELRPRRP